MRYASAIFGVAIGLAGCAATSAQEDYFLDDYTYSNADGSFAFSVSAGVLALEGREHVFPISGSDSNLSLLIWQSVSPMVSAEARGTFGGGWTVLAEGRVASSGFAYMEDYDWFGTYFVSYDPDDWTHRSQHPNTVLDWFAEGSVALGYDFDLRGGMKVNVNSGISYTDVQWAASDGSYNYSVGGFRDSSGTFSGPGITYRQQLPSVFVGIDTSMETGDLTVDLGLRAGLTVMGSATDWHWQRTPPLRFEDMFMPAPTLGGRIKASYAVHDNFSVFVDGRVDKIFLARGDTEIYNNDTGTLSASSTDTAGAELLSASISAGIKGTFK